MLPKNAVSEIIRKTKSNRKLSIENEGRLMKRLHCKGVRNTISIDNEVKKNGREKKR